MTLILQDDHLTAGAWAACVSTTTFSKEHKLRLPCKLVQFLMSLKNLLMIINTKLQEKSSYNLY